MLVPCLRSDRPQWAGGLVVGVAEAVAVGFLGACSADVAVFGRSSKHLPSRCSRAVGRDFRSRRSTGDASVWARCDAQVGPTSPLACGPLLGRLCILRVRASPTVRRGPSALLAAAPVRCATSSGKSLASVARGDSLVAGPARRASRVLAGRRRFPRRSFGLRRCVDAHRTEGGRGRVGVRVHVQTESLTALAVPGRRGGCVLLGAVRAVSRLHRPCEAFVKFERPCVCVCALSCSDVRRRAGIRGSGARTSPSGAEAGA